MKRFLSLIGVVLIFASASFAQTTLYSDDFEGLTVGGAFVEQANQDWWTTWTPGSTSEDAVVSDDYANSGTNSIIFAPNDDVILQFGDRASGKYEITFYLYVESGQGGAYFNLQKWEEPANEWAFNCTFEDDGNFDLEYAGQSHTYTYTVDQWVEVKNVVDLDNDLYQMFIDGELKDEHQYSVTALGSSGVKRLGCIDFYGSAGMDFYIDDVSVVEVIASQPPIAEIDDTEIVTDGSEASTFSIENTGVEDLYYIAYPTYPEEVAVKSNNVTNQEVQLGDMSENTQRESAELTFLENSNISYFTYASENSRTMQQVIKVSPEQLNSFGATGMYLNTVVCYVGETQFEGAPLNSFEIVVYGREDLLSPGPGEVIATIPFTPTEEYTQNTVTLPEPIYLDGSDIWFGFKYEDPGYTANDTVFAFSYDDAAATAGANWLSLGVGWRDDVESNLGVVGIASGTPVENWLSLSPMDGIIQAGSPEEITISYDLANLEAGSTYSATVVVSTNDPNITFTEIPVTLTVASEISEAGKMAVMTYPNPTSDALNIKSDEQINSIKILNINGQLVRSLTPYSNVYQVNTADLQAGIYFFTIKTENQEVTQKIIVQ